MNNDMERKVDEVKERCKEIQKNTQEMVEHFKVEIEMRRLQKEYEEK